MTSRPPPPEPSRQRVAGWRVGSTPTLERGPCTTWGFEVLPLACATSPPRRGAAGAVGHSRGAAGMAQRSPGAGTRREEGTRTFGDGRARREARSSLLGHVARAFPAQSRRSPRGPTAQCQPRGSPSAPLRGLPAAQSQALLAGRPPLSRCPAPAFAPCSPTSAPSAPGRADRSRTRQGSGLSAPSGRTSGPPPALGRSQRSPPSGGTRPRGSQPRPPRGRGSPKRRLTGPAERQTLKPYNFSEVAEDRALGTLCWSPGLGADASSTGRTRGKGSGGSSPPPTFILGGEQTGGRPGWGRACRPHPPRDLSLEQAREWGAPPGSGPAGRGPSFPAVSVPTGARWRFADTTNDLSSSG